MEIKNIILMRIKGKILGQNGETQAGENNARVSKY
jgi:hypothetical protein